MKWADYVLQKPQTLEERKPTKSIQYQKEKHEHEREHRTEEVVQQLLEKPAD